LSQVFWLWLDASITIRSQGCRLPEAALANRALAQRPWGRIGRALHAMYPGSKSAARSFQRARTQPCGPEQAGCWGATSGEQNFMI
jgi:hypothetical protein